MAILRFVFTVLLLLCLTLSSSFGQDKDKKADDDKVEKKLSLNTIKALTNTNLQNPFFTNSL